MREDFDAKCQELAEEVTGLSHLNGVFITRLCHWVAIRASK